MNSISASAIVAIGVASIASGIAYTGGPYPLGYNGLGDVFGLVRIEPVGPARGITASDTAPPPAPESSSPAAPADDRFPKPSQLDSLGPGPAISDVVRSPLVDVDGAWVDRRVGARLVDEAHDLEDSLTGGWTLTLTETDLDALGRSALFIAAALPLTAVLIAVASGLLASTLFSRRSA